MAGLPAFLGKVIKTILLRSQRESFETVKFFDSNTSMIFDISKLPESKYAFSRKCRVCGFFLGAGGMKSWLKS